MFALSLQLTLEAASVRKPSSMRSVMPIVSRVTPCSFSSSAAAKACSLRTGGDEIPGEIRMATFLTFDLSPFAGLKHWVLA